MLRLLLLLTVSMPLYANTCNKEGVWLQVLGSGGPEIQTKRASSSYVIWLDGQSKILIDAGGGSALRFGQAEANVKDLDVVLFTHLHVDHTADFPALIKSSFFENRERPLKIFGPEGNQVLPSTKEFINLLFSKHGAWPYLNDFIPGESSFGYELEAENLSIDKSDIQNVYENNEFKISGIKVHHGPLPAIAWHIDIKDKGSVTFTGDMSGQYGLLPKLGKKTDLLVAHHAISESTQGVGRLLHMPPSVIGKLAKQSDARTIVLSHRMLRSLGHEEQSEKYIRESFKNIIYFANDLDCYEISSIGN